ncbi:MAG TPA: NAD-dependent epimerase/dehydratase family protein [Dehalococcoidia bacterium]|nr:NAD-dependent epimerase/dehydratase family protein [Dehalococcoidia bacterium]
MYKYFITGGAGFIGSHLVDRLIGSGKVTVYDNLSSGRKDFIEHHLGKSNFHFIQADLLDFDTLNQAIANHDIVFHLAANPDVRAGSMNTNLDLQQGTMTTHNVLAAMRVNKISKIVFASSSTVYGEAGLKPVAEDYGPLLPISLYGASKLACEGLLSAFCHLFDMQAWIFRFANVVGSRASHGVIFDFINKLKQNPGELEILGDGTQEKPYLYIDDCIDGILFGWKHSQEQVNIFNLGTDSSTNVTTIASMLVEAMGLSGVKFSYTGGERGWRGDVPQVRFDITKMKKLGWKPGYSSDEAVRQAIKVILSKDELLT